MPQSAPLAEWPEYTSKERHRIQIIINQRDHLVSINPERLEVQRRVEAFNWALDALAHDDVEMDEKLFYVLRDRRNNLELMDDSEMNGFLGAEMRAIDWVMEEILPGSGHRASWKKIKPWLVYSSAGVFGGLDGGVVLAETADEAIEIVRSTKELKYHQHDTTRPVYTAGVELEAREISLRKGLIYHNNIY